VARKHAKKVAQLVEQKKQWLPPLKVFSHEELARKYQSFRPLNDASTEDYKRLASNFDMDVYEMVNEADFPKAELAYKYAPGGLSSDLSKSTIYQHKCKYCMTGSWKS
jgi:hypothetical protein